MFFEVPVPLLEVLSYLIYCLCLGLCGVEVLVLSVVASDVCDPGSAHCAVSDVH